jgi:hypothetical protein
MTADSGAAAGAAGASAARMPAITASVASSNAIRSSSIPSSLPCRMRSSTTAPASLAGLMPRVADTPLSVCASRSAVFMSAAVSAARSAVAVSAWSSAYCRSMAR